MTYLLSPRIARIKRSQPRLQPITFWNGQGGLITSVDEKMLSTNDFKTLTNVRYELGKLRTREGLYKLTTNPLASSKYLKTIAILPISTTNHTLGVSDDYKLYSITGTEGSMAYNAAIATLSGNCVILPFSGYAILCDTGYMKYYNGTTVNIMYDDGTGSDGYMWNNLTDDDDASIKLYTGSAVLAGNIQQSSSFGSGFTIPLTRVRAWLSRTGAHAVPAAVTAKCYNGATGALISTSTTSYQSDTLSTNAAVYDFDFAAGTNISPATFYIFAIAYDGGDVDNAVNVHYDTVASGGLAKYNDGSWSATDTTKNYLIGVKPGLPPKASFGCVADNRLHVVDPNEPGRLKICAPGDGFDWSTPTLAGSVNAIDDSATGFPIGAVIEKYGDVWIFGKAKQAYLARLAGSSPTDWVMQTTGQEAFTSHLSIQDTIDDLIFASGHNCHSLTGSDVYGDVRSGGPGDPVKNLFASYWTTAAFSGYWGRTGQYFIYLPTYGTMVLHTKDPMKRWSRYTYKGLTESAYFGSDTKLYVGCTDGHFYRLGTTTYTDSGTAYDVTLESGKLVLPFGDCELIVLHTNLDTSGATTANLIMYPNYSGTAKHTIALSSATFPPEWKCGMNAHALQIKMDTVAFTATTYFEPIIISARKLYGLGQR